MKNLFGKSRTVDNPYATYRLGNFEWRVLKTYQDDEREYLEEEVLDVT